MERLLEVKAHLHNLSLLVMSPVRAEEAFDYVAGLCLEARTHFLKLADAHHVVIRALEPLEQAAVAAGAGEVAQFANAALGRSPAGGGAEAAGAGHGIACGALAGADR